MISIDFQGGMHGNYLEYICNRFLAGIDTLENTPFNSLGAAHKKTYLRSPVFRCGHFSTEDIRISSTHIIAIKLTAEDLLPAQCISLLRSGDHNISPELLEHDTYNKLNNKNYQWLLDNIIQNYFQDQIVKSYTAVMDPLWPVVRDWHGFQSLPEWIRQECLNGHGLYLHELSESSPDCPRYILREFFKIGFNDPQTHGFLTQQEKFQYDVTKNVYTFPFSSFYNSEEFRSQISQISDWTGLKYQSLNTLDEIHQQFLSRQIYKDAKKRCDILISKISVEENFLLPNLNVIEEAYIDSRLEKIYNKVMPLNVVQWFRSTNDIKRAISND